MGLFSKKKTTSTKRTTTATKKSASKKTVAKRQSTYGEYSARIRVNHKTGETELLSIRKAQKPRSKK